MSQIFARCRHSVLIPALTVCCAVVGCGTFSGCSSGDASESNGTFSGEYPIKIVTTCGMVTNIVQVVAGEHAEVTGLMGEDVDPHLYKPIRNDVSQLMAADIVFYSGLMLEGHMGDTFVSIGRGKPVFAVTEGIDESYLREPPEFAGHWDPHVWMDVSDWRQCVEFVAKTLADFDPQHADAYQKNADSYRAELKKLDEYVKKVIDTVPEDQRVLITAHDAFGYFSRSYGIPVRSVQGWTTDSQAAVSDVNDLVDYIVKHRVKAIFIESSVSPKNIQALIEGAESKGWKVVIGGELFSDAMGKPGTYEGTYIGMLDHNATVVARALGGEAPKKGMNGKLTVD